MHIGMYMQKYIHHYVSHRGEVLVVGKMYQICYQEDRTGSRSVPVNLYLTYDASRAHRRGRGDNAKI